MATKIRNLSVGVLALQGAFREHINALENLSVKTIEVRLPSDLISIDALIIPGGESPAISLLAQKFDLLEAIKEFSKHRAIWGTCAGAILLARTVDSNPGKLQLLDIEISRNAYGRQRDSFIEELQFAELENQPQPFPAIFIRAPRIKSVGSSVEVLARTKTGDISAVRSKSIMATSFHPELSQDLRVHRYFLEKVIPPANRE